MHVPKTGCSTLWGKRTLHVDKSRFAVVTATVILIFVSYAAANGLNQVTDRGISDAVEDELWLDAAVPHNRLDVVTVDGVVTLTGTVTNITAKRRAVELSSIVRGVRSVVDRIRVVPLWDVSDGTLCADVRSALLHDPATEAKQIDIAVEGALVILKGNVDSWQERKLAELIAGNVRGVREVVNLLDVNGLGLRSDDELLKEIQGVLRWDALLSHRSSISVTVDDGRVLLSGAVCSLAEKNLAVKDAWVSGVAAVDVSELEVAMCYDETRVRNAATAPPSDEEIVKAIHSALFHDPRVLSTTVTAEVVDGSVTLRGQVENLRAMKAAAQDARNTVGVTSVVNRLRLRKDLFMPDILLPDDELVSLVGKALARDPYVERFHIEVNAVDGTIYLTGVVDSFFDKARAEDLACTTVGVMEVKNHLEVLDSVTLWGTEPLMSDFPPADYGWYSPRRPDTSKSDEQIRRDIENQMWWSTQVDSDQVSVMVDDGVATLTGTVDSWREREAATKNAYDGGAVLVRNNLKVEW
jgi:osmotically-inducible protein OsmY